MKLKAFLGNKFVSGLCIEARQQMLPVFAKETTKPTCKSLLLMQVMLGVAKRLLGLIEKIQ